MASDPQVTRLLAFHLQRAVQIHEHVAGVEAESHSLRQAIDHLATGVVLLGDDHQLIYANAAAETMLRSANESTASPTRKRKAADPTHALMPLRALVAEQLDDPGLADGAAFSIPRGQNQRPLSVVVKSLAEGDRGETEGLAGIAIFINDPDKAVQAPLEVLQAAYGLTARETEFAALLAQGLGLDRIAEISGVTKETARSRIKSIFAKTGTHRQAELLRLVLQSSIDVRGPG